MLFNRSPAQEGVRVEESMKTLIFAALLFFFSPTRSGFDEPVDMPSQFNAAQNQETCVDTRRVLLHSVDGRGHCLLIEAIAPEATVKPATAKLN
jgi:hypothetical protein